MPLSHIARSGLCGFTMLVLVLTAGCGKGPPSRCAVSGRVLVDGKPLTTGDLRLVPEAGAYMAFSPIQSDGRFTLTTYDEKDGVVPGTYKVEVVAFAPAGPGQMKNLAPARYMSAQTSDKTVTIESPTDSLEINLNWGRERPTIQKRSSRGEGVPQGSPSSEENP